MSEPPNRDQAALMEWMNHTTMNNEAFVGKLRAQERWLTDFESILEPDEKDLYFNVIVKMWEGNKLFTDPAGRGTHLAFFYRVATRLKCPPKMIQDYVFESPDQERKSLRVMDEK